MVRVTWVVLTSLVLISVAVPAWADEKPPVTALVRAKVKSVEQVTKIRSTAVLEVVHVYAGPVEWKGRTFTDWQQAQSTTGREATTPFEIGEEGLWVLVGGGKEELRVVADSPFLLRLRSRKGDTARHPEYLKLAEAIEAVERAKERDRVKTLVGLTADETPEVGM